MPELTGVPVLDFFLLLGAMAFMAAGAFGSVMKFLELFKRKEAQELEPAFGRRAEDVEKLRDEQAVHGTRLAVCETKISNIAGTVDAVAAAQETQRVEVRENFQQVFNTLGAISTDVAKIARNGNGRT